MAAANFSRRYGVMLVLLGIIAYKLAFTWVPQWIDASGREGMQVSQFSVEDRQGRRVPLSQFRGAPLILNFWASWCIPCRVEIPLLADALPGLREQGKQLLGINLQESWPDIDRYRLEVDSPYPVYRDNGELAEQLGVGLLPALVIIDQDGRVQNIVYGFRPWVRWYLQWWI